MDLGRGMGPEALEVRALLSGQAVQLVKDVNATETYPSNLTPVGSNLFYTVEDSTGTGQELVATSSQGTTVLYDFGSGSSGYGYSYGSPTRLTGVGSSLFFTLGYGTSQLWTSDGTADGTSQVTLPGSSSASVQDLTAVGNTLLFDTYDYTGSGQDYRLWAISPGSTSPTLLKDFSTSNVYPIGAIGNTAYLSVGGNLWTSDGTAGNTVERKDSSQKPIPAPDQVFSFQGQVDYLSSGTTSSTVGVLGSGGETATITGLPASMANIDVVGSSFYFTAASTTTTYGPQTQLWISNGTQAGTLKLKDFSSIAPSAAPSNFAAVNGSLFFTIAGSDGLAQLWTSNGTGQGTTKVKDLGVEATDSYSYYNHGSGGVLQPIGGTLYFTAFDSNHGAELWSDNVAAGTTQLVADINPGAVGSAPRNLVDFGGQLDFSANDGTSPLTAQLWTSGGTSGTTTQVASFSPGTTAGSASSLSNYAYVTLGQKVLVALDDGIRGRSLWATDGTASGTQLLASVDPIDFAVLGGTAYFLGTTGGSTLGLWKTDGTAGGTVEVKDLSSYTRTYPARSNDPSIVASGSHLYFMTHDGTTGVDLWSSDGTSGGTSVVKDFAAPTGGSSYGYASRTLGSLTPFAGKLAFVADTGSLGAQLWVTDGTSSGTKMLTDIPNVSGGDYGYSTSVTSLTVAGGRLYFFSHVPGVSAGLWSSDGTQGNTSEFLLPNMASTDPAQPAVVPTPGNLTAVGSGLVFSLDYTGHGSKGDTYQLWTTIGAGGGADPIQASDGSSFSSPSSFVSMGSKALFQSHSSSGAEELWATDGTTSGTSEVKVINPNSSGYYNYGYDQGTPLVSNGIVYFQGDDGTHGLELWQSDGTSAGTFMVQDINPGSNSSNPMELGVVNNHLIVTADDGTHGLELMAVVPSSQESAPTITALPTQFATVGESFRLDMALYASDPNVPPLPLTYSLGADAPSGLALDSNSGVLTWPGSADQTPGAYTFTLTVTDNSSPAQGASTSITIDVSSVEPPSLAPILTQYIGVGHTFVLDVSDYASDPNYPPFPLTYQLISGPSGATIDPNTGVLTWATASNQATIQYPFAVQVSDNSSPPLVASATFNVQVNTVSPPVIQTIPAQAENAGKTFTLNLKHYASDPNTPALPLTFTLGSGAPSGASIDPTTGIFTWVIPSNETTGPRSFTLNVSDDSKPANTASKAFIVTVYAPNAALPPLLNTLPTVSVTVGETQTSNLSTYASDPNTPPLPLTFSLGTDAPAYASIDATTGVLTLSPPSGQATGTVTFTVIVADNEPTPQTVSGPITVYVNALQPPGISTIPTQSVHLGDTLTLNLSHYAHDGNSPALPLTYALGANAPTGASLDPTSGVLTWTPDTSLSPGTYTIPFTVSDGGGAKQTTSGTVTVNVAPANGSFPPVLNVLPSVAVTVGETQTSNLSSYASDPNTPPLPLTFSLGADAPAYASIDAKTGVLTLSPPSGQATGPVTFTVIVADNEPTPQTASQPITVYVNSVFQPFITSIPAQGVTIGSTLSFGLSQYAHDYNSPPLPLTYTLGADAPSGASIDPTTGVFTWTPGNDIAIQTYTISFTASNGVSTNPASGSFTVAVAAPGTVNPPALATLPSQSVTVGETLISGLSTYASDPNTPPLPLTYSLGADAPAYASIDATTGVLTLSPPSGQATGPVTFTVIVADNEPTPQTASQPITVTVAALQPPTILTISTQSATIGQAFTLNLHNDAFDPNSPALPLTFALGAGAPTDASLNSTTGVFSWTPTAIEGAGTYNIPFTVSDGSGAGQTVSGTLTINVSTATVNPPGFTPIPPQSVTIGETLTFNAGSYASDPNTPPLPLTFSLGSTPAPPPGLSIDPTSGVLTWDTTASGVSAQAYTVMIVATDNGTPTSSGSVQMTLTALAVLPPSISSNIPTPTLADGQTLSLDLSQYATDQNTPVLPLTYSLVTDTIAGATLDPSTGLLQWTVPSDQPAGPITVTFEVSDSLTSGSPTQGSFTIQVSSDQPPVIQSIPTTDAPVGTPATVDLSQYASDPNTPPQALTYSLGSGAPTGATLDPSSGLFSWTPPSGQAAGPVTLNFTVTGTSGLSASGSFVVDVVVPPGIQTIPTKNAPVGQGFSLNLGQYASDSNSPAQTLTYALTGTPPSGASVDASTGAFTWTPPADQQPGPLTFGFTVTDTSGLSTPGSFTVNVVAPPVLQSIPSQAAMAGKPLSSFNLKSFATDPNSPAETLTYALSGTWPSGASIDPSTGVFSWTPGSGQAAGTVAINYTVSNSSGANVPGTFSVNVLVPPTLEPIPTQAATIGKAFTLNVSTFAGDPNVPALPLTYSLGAGAPSGASIDPTTGVLTWAPGAGQPTGLATITVNVADNEAAPQTASRTFTVNVSSATVTIVPPVLKAVSQAASVNVGQAFTLDVSQLASDPNTPPLPLTYRLGSGAPAGMSINPSSGLLTWDVPANEKIGDYSATVIVSDNGSPSMSASQTLNFTVVDPSSPPTVTSPTISTKKGVTITLTFSQPVDPATASNPLNYVLTQTKKTRPHKKPGPVIHIGLSVSFNPATGQVTLKAAKKPKAGMIVTLTVIGGPNGIAKSTGLRLAGNGSQAGTNFVATISGKKITPTAVATGGSVVVRTAGHHSAAPAVRRGPSSGAPGGPLALRSR